MNNNREKALIKNTIIISIGIICTKLITFFLLPLYTGILSTSEYGIVDLLNTLVSLLLPIITFQVEQAAFRELLECRNDDKKKKIIISNSIISVSIQCAVFFGVFFLFSFFIHNDYKWFLFINIIVNIYASLLLQISRGIGDTKRYSVGSFLTALFTIIFSIFFLVILKLQVYGMLSATIIGQIGCFIYLFFTLKIYKYLSFKSKSFSVTKRLWKYSVPLIPNAISWWVFSSSDRVIVSSFLGLSMNGILSVSSKFSGMYVTLYNIFDRSWIESISLHINDKDIEDYFNKTFNIILKIFVSILILLISIMPFVFRIMINENYNYGYYFVPILLLGALFTVCQGLLAVVYAAKKDTKSIAKTSVAAAILNIIIHLSLIKFIGLYAAAISTLLAYFILFIYRFIDIRKRYLNVLISKKLLFVSTLLLLFVIVVYYCNNDLFSIVCVIITSMALFIFNYKLIKEMVIILKNKMIKIKKKENENVY